MVLNSHPCPLFVIRIIHIMSNKIIRAISRKFLCGSAFKSPLRPAFPCHHSNFPAPLLARCLLLLFLVSPAFSQAPAEPPPQKASEATEAEKPAVGIPQEAAEEAEKPAGAIPQETAEAVEPPPVKEEPPWVYTPLKPLPGQSKVCREVVTYLDRYHFIDVPLNNQLSSRLFDKYLDRLDPNRDILLQADIEEFVSYRHQLDDALKRGDLRPAYQLFNRFRKRAIERLQKELDNLPSRLASLDFSRQESILTERDQEPYPATAAAADDLWRKRLKSQVLEMRLAGDAEEKIRRTIAKRLREQLEQIQKSKARDVFSVYMISYTHLYDSHTEYMSPRSAENFNINMSLSLEGIGAMLRSKDDYTEVVSLVPGGPADLQGDLQPGDRIIGISQGAEQPAEDIIGWRLDDVIPKIRGPRGSSVLLRVLPAGEESLETAKTIPIVRNKVLLKEQGASKQILELERNGRIFTFGVIDLPSFYLDFRAMQRRDPNYRSTSRDVAKIIEELQEAKVDGIIVDLRGNGGGSLLEANSLVGLFIEKGPTVQVRHSVRRLSRQGKFRSSPYYDGPLAVLINRLSASASEIFSGAIQDYGRGVVIGGPSFGKGTVQSLHRLSSGQMKVTDAKFYRISGDSTQLRGIIPDVLYPPMYNAQHYGESAHEKILPWDRITPLRHRRYNRIVIIRPELQARHAARTAKHPEFVYLAKRAEYWQSQQEESKQLSLNEALRQEQRAREKEEREAIEALRRTEPKASTAAVSQADDDQIQPASATATATAAAKADNPAKKVAHHEAKDKSAPATPKVAAKADNPAKKVAHHEAKDKSAPVTPKVAVKADNPAKKVAHHEAKDKSAPATPKAVAKADNPAKKVAHHEARDKKDKDDEVTDPLLIEAGQVLIDSVELLAGAEPLSSSPFAALFRSQEKKIYPIVSDTINK